MKKKFLSLFSVLLLVTPSLTGTGEAFAETIETEGSQEQKTKKQIPNKGDVSDSTERTLENSLINEPTKSTVDDSVGETNSDEVTNNPEFTETTDSSLASAVGEDSVPQEERTSEKPRLSDDVVASGTLGTSEWTIDGEGTLHIEAGKFGFNPNRMQHQSPWNDYANEIKQITFEGPVTADQNSDSLFAELGNLTKINHLELLDTSKVTDMSFMFFYQSTTSKLTSLDVSSFDTSNVTDMSWMFSSLREITNLDVSHFNTSKVIDMSSMFYCTSKLTTLDVSHFNTSKVTDMSFMFSSGGLTSLDLSSFNTSNVIDMSSMFSSADGLTELDVSGFDTSNVTNMSSMFSSAGLTSLDLSSFNTSNVTNMRWMFARAGLTSLDLLSFDTSKVTDMSYMFYRAAGLIGLDLSSFNTSNVTNMSYMFEDADELTELDLSSFNTSKVMSMYKMFDFFIMDFKELKLGSKFKFLSGAGLQDIFYSPTGKWQNVGTGTKEQPNGKFIMSSSDLMAKYDGKTMADTYVWQPSQVEQTGDVIIRYVDTFGNNISDPVTGFEIQPVTFSGKIGDPADGDLYYFEARGWVLLSNLPTGVVYEKNPKTYDLVYDNAGAIYVNYEDISGNTLKPEERNTEYISKFDWSSGTLPPSVAYEITPNEIDGYKFIGTEGDPQVGNIGANEIKKVTFKYDKINHTSVTVRDSTLYVGTDWKAEDNFDNAIDKDGNPVDFKDVTVEGTVDTTKSGTYEVIYSYEGVTSVATITVKAIQTAVNIHDSTLYVESDWKAKDNFDGATDKDGNPVDFKDVTVEGTVDTTKAGTYEVTYSYDGVTSMATITVKDKEKDSTPSNDDNKNQNSQDIDKKTLPQTGEQTNNLWTLAGFLTLLFSLIYLVSKRKKSD